MADLNADKVENVLTPRTLPRQKGARWDIGPLILRVRHSGYDWLFSTEHQPQRNSALKYTEIEVFEDKNLSWKRWAFREDDASISLRPTLPDRSLVIRPQSPLTLAPHNEVLFFVSIPMSIQIHLGSENTTLLDTIPTAILSNTWFGLPTDGELCYSLKSGAARDLASTNPGVHRIICPLTLRNHSPEPLPVNKLSLPVSFFHLYQGTTRFWTNGIHLTYQGHNRFSAVDPLMEAPTYEPIIKQLAEARRQPQDNLVRRTFATFFSNLGLM